MSELWISIGVSALVLIYFIILYNRLIALQQTRKNAFADIDVQLKLRHDLIPNLVEAVKKYAAHEKEVLESVTTARSNAMRATALSDKSVTESVLDKAMMNLLAVSENYPELKADANFRSFQDQLTNIESSIAAARRFFNNSTAELNTASQQFPANMVASLAGFRTEGFFELEEDKRAMLDAPVQVKF